MRRSQFRDRNKETSRISNTTHDTKHERKQTGEHEKMVDVLRNSKVKKKKWKKRNKKKIIDSQRSPTKATIDIQQANGIRQKYALFKWGSGHQR